MSPSADACPPAATSPAFAAPPAGDAERQHPHQGAAPAEPAHAAAQLEGVNPAAVVGMGEPQQGGPQAGYQAVAAEVPSAAFSPPPAAVDGSQSSEESAGATLAEIRAAMEGMQPLPEVGPVTPSAPPSGAAEGSSARASEAAAAAPAVSSQAAAGSGQPSPPVEQQLRQKRPRGRPPSQRTLEKRAWEGAHPGRPVPPELLRKPASKDAAQPRKRRARAGGALAEWHEEEDVLGSDSGSDEEKEVAGRDSQSVQHGARADAEVCCRAGLCWFRPLAAVSA